jgi:hypothetical protein
MTKAEDRKRLKGMYGTSKAQMLHFENLWGKKAAHKKLKNVV